MLPLRLYRLSPLHVTLEKADGRRHTGIHPLPVCLPRVVAAIRADISASPARLSGQCCQVLSWSIAEMADHPISAYWRRVRSGNAVKDSDEGAAASAVRPLLACERREFRGVRSPKAAATLYLTPVS